MDVYEKVSLHICEANSPKTLKEIKNDIRCLVPEIDLLPILNELVKRGDIVSRCINTNDLDLNSAEPSVTVYWRASQLASNKPNKSQYLKSNVITTPRSAIRPPTSVRSRLPFKSPAKIDSSLSPVSSGISLATVVQPTTKNDIADEELLDRTVQRIRTELEEIDKEIAVLSGDYSEDELQSHIDALHEYNEIKDVGQILLGKIAEHEGTTTASLYDRFGLDVDS